MHIECVLSAYQTVYFPPARLPVVLDIEGFICVAYKFRQRTLATMQRAEIWGNPAGSPIFFVKLPPTQQLCHVSFKLNQQTESTMAQTLPQTQMLVCRQLLFLCRDIIASPHYGDESLLDVIMSIEYFKQKKYLALCKKLGLQPLAARAAKPEDFQACFMYTLKFRISSEWIQIGNFLVKGPDVVMNTGKPDAVELEILAVEGQMTVKVRPNKIRNPPPTLDNFDICYQSLRHFESDENSTIEDFAIYRNWCHILPSMKKGQLVRVSHKMEVDNRSSNIPRMFEDYKGLRRYWKNLYGIRLPETDEGMVFGSVYFKLIGRQLFTYPLCCLRTREIQILPRCDGPSIVKDFMSCAQNQFGSVCGLKLLYSSKACYATNKLTDAVQIVPGKLQNITMNTPQVAQVPQTMIPRENPEAICEQEISISNNADIIPSSQIDGEEVRRTTGVKVTPDCGMRLNFPKNPDGKFVPTFSQQKSRLPATATCGSKIDVAVSDKIKKARIRGKSLGCKAKRVARTAQHIVKGLQVKSEKACETPTSTNEKFKTPRQINRSMEFDSGYDSTDTPGLLRKAASHLPTGNFMPKKLCFDLPKAFDRESDTLTPVNEHDRRSESGSSIMHGAVAETPRFKPVRRSVVIVASASCSDQGNKSGLSVMKNHDFDKLFQSAGKACSTKKNMKKHSFDQLFQSAGSSLPPSGRADEGLTFVKESPNLHEIHKRTDAAPLWNTSIKSNEAEPRMKVLKNHSFDKLFQSASTFKVAIEHGWPGNDKGGSTGLGLVAERDLNDASSSAEASMSAEVGRKRKVTDIAMDGGLGSNNGRKFGRRETVKGRLQRGISGVQQVRGMSVSLHEKEVCR